MKYLLVLILVIVAAVVALIFGQPSEFRIERGLTIAAPASEIRPYLTDFRKFNEWSPWMKMDPAAKIEYTGNPGEKDSSFSWAGKQTGEGTMTLIDPEKIIHSLEFRKPFEANHLARFGLSEESGKTRITWEMTGRNGFMGKTMSLVMNPDKMIGGQFEQGLADLKKLVEEKP